MSPIWLSVANTICTGVIVGLIVQGFTRQMTRRETHRENEREKREQLRVKETKMRTDLLLAIGKLCYATAIAQRDGHTNGEMREGLEAYKEAKQEYFRFVNGVHAEYIEEE